MKRKLIFLFFLIIVPFIVFAYPVGDVDGDNKVNNMDYVKVRNHIRKTSLLISDSLKRADVTSDNKIDNMDYVLIRNIIRGKSTIISTSTPTPSPTPKVTPKPTATPTPKPTVTPKVAVGITLDKTNITLYVSGSRTINATITPSDAVDKKVTWTSSDSTVAKVNSKGQVLALKAGTATITAKTSNGKTATCAVKVKSRDITVYFYNPGYTTNDKTTGGFKSDAIFIKFGDKSLIIDGGLRSRKTQDGSKTMYNNFITYLKDYLKVTKVDYYIGTHGHSDHVGMAGALIKEFGIKTIYVPVGDVPEKHLNEDSNNKWYEEKENIKYAGVYKNYTISQMLRQCKTKEERLAIESAKIIKIWAGSNNTNPYTFNLDFLKFTVLNPLYSNWPTKDEVTYDDDGKRTNSPINANSLVLRMDNGNTSFLFAGDCSNIAKNDDIYAKYGDLMKVDVYKNGHHHDQLISSYNTQKKRYKYSQPKYVVLPSTDVSQFNKAATSNYFTGLPNVYSTNCGPVVIKSNGLEITSVSGKKFYKNGTDGATCVNKNYD